ncbi:hypothetical protein BK049_11875 [Bacillus xiamenensis]|uniref:Uncharacterized protein n=1 Tax=Bacillus xiamenensis TaxID=1178537 RepID=A0AAC9NEJ5_9BACI|nr:hypothetical protein BK049_11875 [Bacillus xiamenensis]
MKVKELFTEAKKVVEEYKAKAEELAEQEKELKADLEALQQEMTMNMLEQENAPVSERVYLKIRNKEIVSKAEIIDTLLEELEEERTALKLEYVPKYREALGKADIQEYNATKIAEKYRYLMLKEISEIGRQMQEQYREIAPEIDEVFQDKGVLEQYPRLAYAYTYENYVPSFSWFENSVVSKNEVFSACRGNLPHGLKEPKEMDVE